MELVLPDPPAAGYSPGHDVSGLLKYNITSEQQNIYDVNLDFDGIVSINPLKFKYEAHRSIMRLIEQSQLLFWGPVTMKRQLLAWPFTFKIPATTIAGGSTVPLPPTMDIVFREGLRVNVKYSITATIRFGSNHGFGKQETRIVFVKPSTTLTTLQRHSDTLSFPIVDFQTCAEPGPSHSSFWSFFNWPEIVPPTLRQVLHLEIELPSTLFCDQQERVTCCLSGTTESGNTLSDPQFIIETFELVLRSRLTWQTHFQTRRHVGTITKRPAAEICADGRPVSLPGTFQLEDFLSQGETPLLQSYDSVIPEVSLSFTLAAIVVLRHQTSRRHLVLGETIPVALHGSTASNLFPPAYRCYEAAEETDPPVYA